MASFSNKKIVVPVVLVALAAAGTVWYVSTGKNAPAEAPAPAAGEPVKVETVTDAASGATQVTYTLSDALNDVASGKKVSSDFDVSKLPISNKGDLSANSPMLLELRDKGSDIPEKILTAKEYDLSALGLDPRVVLEGYVYDTYKKRGEYDQTRLAVMPLGSDAYLQLVLKEIYSNHPEDFPKFADRLIKRQGNESSRRFNIIIKMLEYGKSGGKFDITDPTYVLNNQNNFFLKWAGWNDLNESERQVLFRGKRIFDRYATMKEADFKANIDKEIADFEAYMTDYRKAGLDKFWPGSFYLPYMLGNLYAIKGDYDKGIEVATTQIEATKLTPRKEQSPVFTKDFNAIEARIGFLHLRKAKALEAAGKKSEALESYKKAEELMHHDLLVMPLTTPDIFVVWSDVQKKIATLK